MKKAALHNLGCKVNAYETEAMKKLLEGAGYEIVPFEEKADVYIVNTCTVTNIADRKSRQMLHRAKKTNPEGLVVATGCYVQTSSDDLLCDTSVDLIIGNNRKKDLISILADYEKGTGGDKGAGFSLIDIGRTGEYEDFGVSGTTDHVRAYVKVQDGCNQFCSYCIIPYARGRVRSRGSMDVKREIEELAQKGFREVVLTGIHLSSYGTDLDDENLLSLIQTVASVPGIERVRLGSLEPGIITREFAEGLSEIKAFCPHFHLSLQSGCDATLKRMNRRYTTSEYEEKCTLLREVFDRPALTTDVIAGFPGETEDEFGETLDFLKRLRLFETHVFKYSRRKGTRAAVMEGQVPEGVKAARSHILMELDKENSAHYINENLGREAQILVEEKMTVGNVPCWCGHTAEYIKAVFPVAKDPNGGALPPDLTGKMVKVRITGLQGDRLASCSCSDSQSGLL